MTRVQAITYALEERAQSKKCDGRTRKIRVSLPAPPMAHIQK
jgi:hypothetical protein